MFCTKLVIVLCFIIKDIQVSLLELQNVNFTIQGKLSVTYLSCPLSLSFRYQKIHCSCKCMAVDGKSPFGFTENKHRRGLSHLKDSKFALDHNTLLQLLCFLLFPLQRHLGLGALVQSVLHIVRMIQLVTKCSAGFLLKYFQEV